MNMFILKIKKDTESKIKEKFVNIKLPERSEWKENQISRKRNLLNVETDLMTNSRLDLAEDQIIE